MKRDAKCSMMRPTQKKNRTKWRRWGGGWGEGGWISVKKAARRAWRNSCWHFSLTLQRIWNEVRLMLKRKETQFSSPTLRSLANFHVELEQICCSLSAAKACMWNIRRENKLHVTEKFVFPHHKCHEPQNVYRLENSISFNFCGNISIFEHVSAELQRLQ